jgi:hypothetical protein
MHCVLIALGAELAHLQTIRIVAPVLLGDVVALLAILAGQGDLRSNVAGLGHGIALLVTVGLAPTGGASGRTSFSSEGRT